MRAALLVALLGCSPGALACGVCVEDKMAAVYDHAVVTAALGRKHHVAFFHVDGALVAGEATQRSLERAVQASAGADKGGVRVSVPSASLSVAFDPQRVPLVALHKDLERRLAAQKLSLMLMQVLERPADVNPSVTRALRAQGKQP
jgi:uncharacterized protein (DUF58 family)